MQTFSINEGNEMQVPIKPKDFAKMCGLRGIKTLQRWDRIGLLPARRTLTNRRYYLHSDYELAMKLQNRI